MRHDASSRVIVVAGIATFGAGCLSAVQSRANGGLTGVFNDSLTSAWWSFLTGLLLCTVAFGLPQARQDVRRLRDAVRSKRLSRWACLAGTLGGCFVATQTLAVPHTGVALFTIAIVAGQTGNALLVDKLGLGPSGVQPISWARIAAAVGALGGVVVALGSRTGNAEGNVIPLVALVVLVGGGTAVQMALNGRVTHACGNAVVTTWLNFVTGLLVLCVMWAVRWWQGNPLRLDSWSAPWWMFLGGVLGVVFVTVQAETVRHLGVLVMLMASLAGQLTGAVTLDVLNPGPGAALSWNLFVGVAITMAAAIAAGVAAQRTRLRLRAQAAATSSPQ